MSAATNYVEIEEIPDAWVLAESLLMTRSGKTPISATLLTSV